jgi:hypothetical protein
MLLTTLPSTSTDALRTRCTRLRRWVWDDQKKHPRTAPHTAQNAAISAQPRTCSTQRILRRLLGIPHRPWEAVGDRRRGEGGFVR